MFARLVTAVLFGALASAQDLGVPTSWREFSNNRSLSERISIAQAGINVIAANLDASTASFSGIGYWQNGNVFSAMANQDYFAKTTTYESTVVNALNTAYSLYANADQYGYNDDAMWWATAAYYAYRAYGNTDMLTHAIKTWQHVSAYQITAAEASAGSTSVKNFSLSGTCDGKSMAGGVFWRPTIDDQGMNSITTGLFLTLSAYLASATGDTSTYLDPAIAAAQWIQNVNINSANIVLDSVNPHDCTRSSASWLFTYNTGKFIEGLAVLSDVTGDSQWKTLLTDVVAAGTKNAPWQGTDGIITEAAGDTSNNDGAGFKAIYIRGLNEAFVRNQDDWDFQVLIHSYIDVQYNALLDLADNNNAYAIDWHGPATSYTAWGQLAALDVLVSAISANT
ncbi:endo-1,6-alpha-mannosidase [Rhodofomes roseus]|uniref:Endo-1,6-alpha-mannosidase n=1 Tax=Rhodofomes roseus TaxID=34475 RepID=A0ABQ8KFV7_9APHY|nr:endo-1,6-alpha-mannosidase [Rhodofomes roseus]KAH9836681.1 endo-1,6-alpha-mannosidase [Rhodofomes roseus]